MALKCAEDRGEKCKKGSTKTETDGVITICVILKLYTDVLACWQLDQT